MNLEILENKAYVSHRIIAKGVFEFDSRKKADEIVQLKNKMTQIKELITDNLSEFEEFGRVRFETEGDLDVRRKQKLNPNYRAEKTYFLNEPQATLLLTFMRNTPKIKKFKVLLVQEFFKMRTQLQISKPQKRTDLISVSDSELDRELRALHFAFANLEMSKNEKRILANEVFKKLNFPTLETQQKRKAEQVFTLTQLLTEFKISFSAQEINLKLESFGIIEYSEKGWEILDIKFGENRKYQERLNPKYYKSTFQELLDIVLGKGKLSES